MNIKTIGDLKKLIANIDDDFKLDFDITTILKTGELNERGHIEYDDIGYSDKVICFSVYKNKRIE